MKNKVIVFVGILFFIFVGNVFSQSTNNQQRIIGTWIDNEGNRYFFNANGTCNFMGENTRYFIYDSKIIIRIGSGENSAYIMEYIISSDGKILVLSINHQGETFSIWLDKQ